MNHEKLWTPEFIGMSFSNFFQFMAQYIMVAALPLLIIDKLNGGEVEAGMAMTFFQIGTVGCRPFAGRLIDSVNKQKLMLLTTSAFFIIMTAFYFFQSLNSILGLRLLQGITFALGTTAAAAIAAMILPLSRKGEGIGYFAVSVNLAMVVGPLIGLLLIESFGADIMFLFLSCMALLTVWVTNRRQLPDEIIKPRQRQHSGWRLSDFIEKRSLPMSLLGGMIFFAYGGVLVFIPLYAKSLGMVSATSLFFFVYALVIVLTRPLIGRAFDRLGADYIVYPGCILFFIGMLLFSQAATLTGMLTSAAILGCGFGALSPAFQTLAVQSAPNERAGVATATYFWSLDIFVGLAAVFLSMAVGAFGYQFMYGVICSASIAITGILYFLWRIRHRKLHGER